MSSTTRPAPDVAVILGDRRAELENAKVIPIIPEILVEVLSPGETPRRVIRKLKQFFTAGVKEVWLIDHETRTAETWTGPTLPEQEITVDDEIASPLLPGFAVRLEELFS